MLNGNFALIDDEKTCREIMFRKFQVTEITKVSTARLSVVFYLTQYASRMQMNLMKQVRRLIY